MRKINGRRIFINLGYKARLKGRNIGIITYKNTLVQQWGDCGDMLEKIQTKKTTISMILFLGFTSCIFAPFELYALNRHELWFALSDIWYIPLACGAAAMAVGFIFAVFLNGKPLRVYQGILFGFGLCIYIQGNFLSIKLGAMSGETVEWGDYTVRMVLDLFIWALIIAVSVVCRYRDTKYSEKVMSVVSLFLTLVQLVTLIVLLAPCIGENKTSAFGYSTEKDVMALSPEQNVIVFVLDRYDEDYFIDLIAEKPDYKTKLDGFTFFSNMVGEYSATRWAVPFMLSGQYCLQGDAAVWKDSSCEGRVYWDELIDNGYEMSVYSEEEDVPARAAENSTNFEKAEHRIASHKLFTVLLYRFVMCKYFPDIVKPNVWLDGYEFDDRKMLDSEYHEWYARNLTLGDILNKEDITADREAPQFKIIHIGGTHEPLNIDEEGNRIEGYSDIMTCAEGSLNIVLKYMDEMKEQGIYDNSAVIITADHGIPSIEPSNPIFLVKPIGARGTMAENTAPVSHKDLGATILDLTEMDLDADQYGTSVLDVREGDERERVCYRHMEDGAGVNGTPFYKLIEYTADSEGNAPEDYHKTGIEYNMQGDIIPN